MKQLDVNQWSFLVPLIGGRWHISPQLAGKMPLIYHLYIAYWVIIYHLPPIKGTRNSCWLKLTAHTWNTAVGRWVSFWEGLLSYISFGEGTLKIRSFVLQVHFFFNFLEVKGGWSSKLLKMKPWQRFNWLMVPKSLHRKIFFNHTSIKKQWLFRVPGGRWVPVFDMIFLQGGTTTWLA